MFARIFLAIIGVVLLLPGICGVGALVLAGPQEIVLMFAIPGIAVGMVGVIVFGAAFERFGSRRSKHRGKGK